MKFHLVALVSFIMNGHVQSRVLFGETRCMLDLCDLASRGTFYQPVVLGQVVEMAELEKREA